MPATSNCPRCGTAADTNATFCPRCGTPLTGASHARRVITVVVCDMVNSTATSERLDAEVLATLMRRLYQSAHQILERYGGTITNLAGDGITAMFGVPVTNEDDALRAVRAVVELREEIGRLPADLPDDWDVELRMRMGVNTGEVVEAGTGFGDNFAAGDTINVAARLEQHAPPGQILIGEATYRLVRDAVMAEGVPPLNVKGKANPVPAYRLLGVIEGAAPRARPEVPLVGRADDLHLLDWACRRATRERACHLVTVLGSEGLGKTRLVEEFLGGIGDRATVLACRCLAYGPGTTTYYPVVQAVRQAAGIEAADTPEIVVAKLRTLVGDEPRAERIVPRVARVLGAGETEGSWEDTFWALRKLFELQARRQPPLVLAIDDLHWAQPTLLDLIEHLAEWSRDAPMLIVCMARPALLEQRPGWGGGRRNGVTFQLGPLSDQDTSELVTQLAGGARLEADMAERITEVSEGNPLFVVELVAAISDEPGEPWLAAADEGGGGRTPPRVQALLSARLDRLDPGELGVIQRAAVIGQRFYTSAVVELLTGWNRKDVRARLASLTRKELICPDSTTVLAPLEHDGQYRFAHGLIARTAYEGMSKETRAELHEQYATWLERVVGPRINQFDEIIGYHLEAAYDYRRQLGRRGAAEQALAERVGTRLAAAGHHAIGRGDLRAAIQLLDRAVALLPTAHRTRLRALFDLANALRWSGQFERSRGAYKDAATSADLLADATVAALATVGRLAVAWYTDRDQVLEHGPQEAERAATALAEAGDRSGAAAAWRLAADTEAATGDAAAALAALERAIGHARAAGDERGEARALIRRCLVHLGGPTPREEVERQARSALEWARSKGTRRLEAAAGTVLARTAAMRGDFAEARALLGEARGVESGLGDRHMVGFTSLANGTVELLAGRLDVAERVLRQGCEELRSMAATGPLAVVEAMLARVLLLRGRDEAALATARSAATLAAARDVEALAAARGAQAVALARRGDVATALKAARAAVSVAGRSDKLHVQATAHFDLAEVTLAAGNRAAAAHAALTAAHRYQAKGDQVSAQAALAFRDGLGASPPAA